VRYLCAGLERLGGLSPLPDDPRVTRHARHLLVLRFDPQAFGGRTRQEFLGALTAEGITPVSPGYIGLHQTPAVQQEVQARFGVDTRQLHLPCTERAAGETVWISQNAFLGDQEDMQDILAAVEKIKRAWTA